MTARKRIAVLVVVAAVLAGAVPIVLSRTYQPLTPYAGGIRSAGASPEMCPWRRPKADMATLFAGSDAYQTKTMVLSGLRLAVRRVVGPHPAIDTNVLYAYTITQAARPTGTVLVQRIAGSCGAIEIVVGISPDGRIVGVLIQRHREPPAVAKVITSTRWLGRFNGLKVGDRWPDEPLSDGPARPVARNVSDAVRTLDAYYVVSRAAALHPDKGDVS